MSDRETDRNVALAEAAPVGQDETASLGEQDIFEGSKLDRARAWVVGSKERIRTSTDGTDASEIGVRIDHIISTIDPKTGRRVIDSQTEVDPNIVEALNEKVANQAGYRNDLIKPAKNPFSEVIDRHKSTLKIAAWAGGLLATSLIALAIFGGDKDNSELTEPSPAEASPAPNEEATSAARYQAIQQIPVDFSNLYEINGIQQIAPVDCYLAAVEADSFLETVATDGISHWMNLNRDAFPEFSADMLETAATDLIRGTKDYLGIFDNGLMQIRTSNGDIITRLAPVLSDSYTDNVRPGESVLDIVCVKSAPAELEGQ